MLLSAQGDETALVGWSDAGFAGISTKSQSGLFVIWEGAPLLYRSSRQTVSALSTAEAELIAAALTWQIMEGLRLLLEEWGILMKAVTLLVDNTAALAIAEHGSTWRTRYFGVRAGRICEEITKGRLMLRHEPTTDMVADGLTKLGSKEILMNVRQAMLGVFLRYK